MDSNNTYQLVLEYLLGEGFASTEQSADKIILNMSESWFQEIVEGKLISEEEYDRVKDKHLERGGMAARSRYDRPSAKKATNAELGIKSGKTVVQKELEKKYGKGASAMDIVKAEIEKKYGKGAVMSPKKKD